MLTLFNDDIVIQMQQLFVQPSQCIRLGSLIDSRGGKDGLCKGKKMFCYCQDHVQQQISALHVVKDHNIQQPTTDLDIDKAAKAFGEWGNGNDSTHKRRGTCTEAVGLIRFLFITLLSVYPAQEMQQSQSTKSHSLQQ